WPSTPRSRRLSADAELDAGHYAPSRAAWRGADAGSRRPGRRARSASWWAVRRAFAALCVLSMLPAPARACSDGPETEALTWTSATTLQAVLAPTGTVVRFDPAAALWSPGRAGLGAF